MLIVLDAGHGGNDPGAIGVGGLQEKDINLSVALKLGQLLGQHDSIDVVYTRETDIFIPLADRATFANTRKADYFISLHCNAGPSETSNGTETLVFRLGTTAARLAGHIQESLVRTIGTTDRGVKAQNVLVLRKTSMPAALVEMAFITNPENAYILKNEQDAIAMGIYVGICAFLGIAPIA